jgi:uncharacterized protein (TIGR02145 family)
MKKIFRITGIILLIILAHSCKKEPDNIIKDIDGNVYNTITIGTQVWMRENLKTTKYRNGDLIGSTSPATLSVVNEITPKYQWAAGNDESKVTSYGRLYTGYAVLDNRKLCPTGWHIPTDADWTILLNYLINNKFGTEETIGKSLATISGWGTSPESGTIGNDQQSNNKSGFTALPSGNRIEWPGGIVQFSVGYDCSWWGIREINSSELFSVWLYYGLGGVTGVESVPGVIPPPFMHYGNSIRCLKD